MIKYPPLIEETIPAFMAQSNDNVRIIIPFRQNPAVNWNTEVDGMELQIKHIFLDEPKTAISTEKTNVIYDNTIGYGMAEFIYNNSEVSSENIEMLPGEFYRFQIAYKDVTDGKIGTYSIVSTGKYLGVVNYNNLFGITNISGTSLQGNSYQGYYTRPLASEALYSYQFSIYESVSNELIETTGEVLWNTKNDIAEEETNNLQSKFVFTPKREIQSMATEYKINLKITTINGYESSKTYTVQSQPLYSPDSGISIEVSQDATDKDNGWATIKIKKPQASTIGNGNYVIERSEDMIFWEPIYYFNTTTDTNSENNILIDFTWQDKTIEQGKTYVYSIRQYSMSTETYSSRVYSNNITVDFEDMFLLDKDRQLRIAFNPNVSGLKDVTLESKTDTIGNAYPFFFKNGKVKYKELPITGLISYLVDENEAFITKNQISNAANPFSATTNLSIDNIQAERKFKLEVLEWLNNGQPKMFKSPTEGNYIVRIMNVSLSPDKVTGRMLHNFSATGYEIAENNYENLVSKLIVQNTKEQPLQDQPYLEYVELHSPFDTQMEYNSTYRLEWFTMKPEPNYYIYLNGNAYRNTTGMFQTPKNWNNYGPLTIPAQTDNREFPQTIRFYTQKSVAQTRNSRNTVSSTSFSDVVENNGGQQWLTISSNDINSKDMFAKIMYVHWLQVESMGDDTSLIINGYAYNVLPEQKITLSDMYITSISVTGQYSITMYATVRKEEE